MSARHSTDSVKAHAELIPKVDQAPLRVALDTLACRMVMRKREVSGSRSLRG
jgi:hypothetical protein